MGYVHRLFFGVLHAGAWRVLSRKSHFCFSTAARHGVAALSGDKFIVIPIRPFSTHSLLERSKDTAYCFCHQSKPISFLAAGPGVNCADHAAVFTDRKVKVDCYGVQFSARVDYSNSPGFCGGIAAPERRSGLLGRNWPWDHLRDVLSLINQTAKTAARFF